MSGALTYLYVPGTMPERFDKALASGADAVVLDLEDAVALNDKESARRTAAEWVSQCMPGAVEIWVRVNPGDLEDVRAVAHSRLTGVWLPKVGSAAEVSEVADLLAEISPHAAISAMIETAGGVFDALSIARAPRVRFLQIGEVDLAADLGVDGSDDSLLFARSHVVAASVAAGIEPPLAAVSRNFRDLDAFEADTRKLAGLGFVGRACIHPAQVSVSREVFVPDEAQISEAEAVLAALSGTGVAVDSRGFLIDEAVARQARRVMELRPS
ncbi:HpcH/HpaI aldolase/citrate lyase family protein [Rhodococcoides kyotonense]|uniref:Citrate lyase subunit beta / citryl-CoA lyase n=1 Tax=Rhodococcoides kyotonense TaxID=398843 RepID=A0A239IKR3_9NOCA|nr:CoA ester lyase [Rhodococcus kyotonensis]SNS93828.1 citrate lyase subunit beta / citryl-CoA lyase [Rhodococcus kyotonensis]